MTDSREQTSNQTAPMFDDAALEMMYLSPPDELANIVTHVIGLILSFVVGWMLWQPVATLELGMQLACLGFWLSMVAVYLFSTLSHAVYDPQARHMMRAWDQGCIFLLIAGTYSPFIWAGSEGVERLAIFSGVWLAAGWGFTRKVISAHRITGVSSLHYLLLGWLPSLPLTRHTSQVSLNWMFIGGACYTLGLIFWALSGRVRFSHAIWHVMVMLGTASHVYAILMLVSPSSPPAA